jgi:hypothetical protein
MITRERWRETRPQSHDRSAKDRSKSAGHQFAGRNGGRLDLTFTFHQGAPKRSRLCSSRRPLPRRSTLICLALPRAAQARRAGTRYRKDGREHRPTPERPGRIRSGILCIYSKRPFNIRHRESPLKLNESIAGTVSKRYNCSEYHRADAAPVPRNL